jgi:putative methionine-R-sulfoxide reductase with GAF domain
MHRGVERVWAARQQTSKAVHAPKGVSWVGFYASPGVAFEGGSSAGPQTLTPGDDEMLLICREPKPACSPIGLHGKCGHGYRARNAVIVRDVRSLAGGIENESYVACDPDDMSELVVPCVGPDGSVFAVLDLDSYQPDAFTADDAHAMHALLKEEGLTVGEPPSIDVF